MSIKVLENLSMFAVVAVRVAANNDCVTTPVSASDALQALCVAKREIAYASGQRGMFTHYIEAFTPDDNLTLDPIWQN